MTSPRPLATLSLLGLLLGCSGEPERVRVSYDLTVVGRGADGAENAHGWRVTLWDAWIHLGPVEIHEGQPLFAKGSWRHLLGIPTASAHPGHYAEGEALADLLDRQTFDLTAVEPATFGQLHGVTGAWRSVNLGLSTSPNLGEHSATARGRAQRGEAIVEFAATVDFATRLEGIPFRDPGGETGAEIDGRPGRVELTVELDRWFERADFGSVATSTGAVVILAPNTQPHNAFRRGATSAAAFRFGFAELQETP